VSEQLKQDKDFAMKIIKLNGLALEYFSIDIKNDLSIINEAIN
jgi:hypothetical protein